MAGVSIYESISKAKTVDSFTVMLDETGIGFKVKVKQREQRRLINEYVRAYRTRNKGQEKDSVLVEPDWYGLGIELTEYFVDWVGFDEPFDKSAAKEFLELFGDAATTLGRKFSELLSDFEKQLFIRRDAEIKNS